MDRLDAMSIIVAVSETGNFSAASRLLKIPVATVSRKVADLEERLGAELFQRCVEHGDVATFVAGADVAKLWFKEEAARHARWWPRNKALERRSSPHPRLTP